MTPHKIEFYVYAENEQEAKELQEKQKKMMQQQQGKTLDKDW